MADGGQLPMVIELGPKDAAVHIRRALLAGVPCFIWGQPGVGKSDVLKQVVAGLDWGLTDVRASLLDPVDIRGVPMVNKDTGRTHWYPPAFLPNGDNGPHVIFLDELLQAPQLVLSACLGLILDRRAGEFVMSEAVRMVGASNRITDRAGAGRMPTALANRFASHICMVPSADDWRGWALAHGVRRELMAWVSYDPQVLSSFDPESDAPAWCSPRSIAMLSKVLDAWELDMQRALTHAEIRDVAAATIGQGRAIELGGFLEIYRDLPHPKDICANPKAAKLPESPALAFAIVTAVASYAGQASTPKAELANALAYANRLARCEWAETGVVLVRDLWALRPDCRETQELATFIREHPDAVIG